MEAAQGTDVTVIFAAVSDPQEDLGITNPETPSGNVTGVSSQTDVTKTVDLAKQATPAIQTLGLLHSGEGHRLCRRRPGQDLRREPGPDGGGEALLHREGAAPGRG